MANTKTPSDELEIIKAEPANSGALAAEVTGHDDGDALAIEVDERQSAKIARSLKDGSEKLAGQAADKARGFVSQGLERTSDVLGSVSKMVGDTAGGIDERLGAEYGDYARKAASALDKASTNLAAKDPDELIEDTKDFVRKSPGLALAGAAVVGFVLARLVKTGLGSLEDDDR